MYMPAFKAKKLVKGVSDKTKVSDLQGTLAGRSRRALPLRSPYDVLINNAGIYMARPAPEVTAKEMRQTPCVVILRWPKSR